MVWVSWPKKASKVPTDITEDVVRDVVLPTGWVDVKVAAVDELVRVEVPAQTTVILFGGPTPTLWDPSHEVTPQAYQSGRPW